MKGMLFTEFLDMVEATWSLDMVDRVIEDARVPSGGAYTAVGSNPNPRRIAQVAAQAVANGRSPGELTRTFGRQLPGRFSHLSRHPFADLVHGLIEGCVAHFGEPVSIMREAPDQPASRARFPLRRQD